MPQLNQIISMVLPHNLLMFARIAAVVNKSSDMERCPTGQSEQEGLANESPSDVTGVEVAPHQRNRHKVDNERHN